MKKYLYAFLFFVVVFSTLVNLTANGIIFHPEEHAWPTVLPFESVSFNSADGTPVHALYLAPADYMDTILFFPGNAGNSSYFEDFAQVYAKYGYGVLIPDYRGFGKTPGKTTERGIYEDAVAAVNFLTKDKKTDPSRLVLWGYSFGGAPAVEAALRFSDVPLKALILQSPFTNIPQTAAMIMAGNYNPLSGFQKTIIGIAHVVLFDKRYDNLAKIGRVRIPIFIAYTQQDTLILWEMSQALADAAPQGSKRFLSPTGKHTDFAWPEAQARAFLNSLP